MITKFCDLQQGMVLVTGSTGTGKSTTLAAMIDHINTTSNCNIISLEDPIEFVHGSKRSQIVQRELGTHIPSFAEGVRASLREDPDVILVGELRDGETISMAMTAAETGHLVLGTLHTTSAVKSVDRIIDALPAEQREQTKSFLAHSLHAVVTQTLVKTPDNRGRRAIVEDLDHEPRDREAHHDRANAPDSGAAANRQGRRHAAHGSGAARRDHEEDSSIRTTRTASRRTARSSSASLPTRPCCRAARASAERRRAMSLIDSFLRSMYMRKGSDLHVIAGDPPRMRVHGDLITLDNNKLDPEELKAELFGIMSEAALNQFNVHDSADFAHSIPDVARFRVNVFRHLNGIGAVFRGIPSKALTLDELKMPKVIARARDRESRLDPRHRQDGLGQVDHARGRDRRDQRQA